MEVPVKLLRQEDLAKELESLKEAIQNLLRSYESMNLTFHQYLAENPELEEHYSEFLTENGRTDTDVVQKREDETPEQTVEEPEQIKQEDTRLKMEEQEEETRQRKAGKAL